MKTFVLVTCLIIMTLKIPERFALSSANRVPSNLHKMSRKNLFCVAEYNAENQNF
ncbi:uncharacterized protein LOC105197306 isoform X2 [Solenopsis invicta]|uniref:uncharacterized protein LOC105197306 isoform X2 n=1 Tax=Solenopsis invicta TaxID=13686 RepID=UPI00193DE91C|nr:uncharacterized protein LOC105197306 isoform X2 [Solenopsis invicta]